MKTSRKSLYIPGACIFFVGILLGLILSGWSLWAEVEASIMVFRTGDQDISNLRCPLMLASAETGTVSASFDNPTAEIINPTVQATINHVGVPRTETTVLTIAPGEKKSVQWVVGPGDKVFGGLVLINVFESSQRDFPSHQGSCGIPISSFPGLSGIQAFVLIFAFAQVAMAGGTGLWLVGHSRLKGLAANATNASVALTGFVFVDMLFIFSTWWGMGLLFFFLAIMLIVIIVTQFILFPTSADRGES